MINSSPDLVQALLHEPLLAGLSTLLSAFARSNKTANEIRASPTLSKRVQNTYMVCYITLRNTSNISYSFFIQQQAPPPPRTNKRHQSFAHITAMCNTLYHEKRRRGWFGNWFFLVYRNCVGIHRGIRGSSSNRSHINDFITQQQSQSTFAITGR